MSNNFNNIERDIDEIIKSHHEIDKEFEKEFENSFREFSNYDKLTILEDKLIYRVCKIVEDIQTSSTGKKLYEKIINDKSKTLIIAASAVTTALWYLEYKVRK